MKVLFNIEQFLQIFKNCHEEVFPRQIVLFLMSIIVIHLVIKPNPLSGKVISGILSFFLALDGYCLLFHISGKFNSTVFIDLKE